MITPRLNVVTRNVLFFFHDSHFEEEVRRATNVPLSGLPRVAIGENVTQVVYLLPYRFHLFYAIESTRAYAITYALQLPFVFVSGLGQTAADCIMVTLVFHICGQMAVLALRVHDLDADLCVCGREVRNVVREHVRLLR